MSAVVTAAQTVDIGGGRGRLRPAAAASVARIDRALGRPLDVNSAWRDPQLQTRLFDAYVRDPQHNPLALPADESIHCRGTALDTDDHSPAQVRLLNEHGWFQTVYRDGELVEPWHFEYDAARDQHRNDPPPSTSTTTPTRKKAREMFIVKQKNGAKDRAGKPANLYAIVGPGYYQQFWGEQAAAGLEGQLGKAAWVGPSFLDEAAKATLGGRASVVRVEIVNADDIGA